MARSRSRRDRSVRPTRGPQFAVQASIGRRALPASRRLGLLPRSLPVGLSRRLVRAFGPTAKTSRRDALYGSRSKVIRDAILEARRMRRLLRNPVEKIQSSLCSRRDRRRQVLHASGVAGVRGGAWSKMMRNASFTPSSFYSCRR